MRRLRIYAVGSSNWGTYEEGKKLGWEEGLRNCECLLKYFDPKTGRNSTSGFRFHGSPRTIGQRRRSEFFSDHRQSELLCLCLSTVRLRVGMVTGADQRSGFYMAETHAQRFHF
jgi:hypothetical protein